MRPATLEPGTLTLCCSGLDARPLFWTDPDGRRHGYEPAAAELAAGELRLAVRWAFRQWSDFVPALLRGECDAVWCGQAITPERRRRVDFTAPYAAFDESVLVRAGDAVAGPADLAGRRVGAIAGSTNMALATTFPGAIPVPFDGATDDVLGDMVAALRAGRVDAVVDDQPALLPLGRDAGLRIAFTAPTANAWGAALAPGSPLREPLSGAIRAVADDGRLAEAWRRWLPELPPPGDLTPSD